MNITGTRDGQDSPHVPHGMRIEPVRGTHRKGNEREERCTGSSCGSCGGARRVSSTGRPHGPSSRAVLMDARGLQCRPRGGRASCWLSFFPSLVLKQKVFKKPHPETAPGAAPGHWDWCQRGGGPGDPCPVFLEELHRGRDRGGRAAGGAAPRGRGRVPQKGDQGRGPAGGRP